MKADGLLPADTEVRSSKYLNNLIEQDHRNVKSRTKVMLGFRRFRSAATTISGIELIHRIRKDQFNLATLRGPLSAISYPIKINFLGYYRYLHQIPLYQAKHQMLDDFLRQQLKNPTVRMKFA